MQSMEISFRNRIFPEEKSVFEPIVVIIFFKNREFQAFESELLIINLSALFLLWSVRRKGEKLPSRVNITMIAGISDFL
jgi:hypothetical protein